MATVNCELDITQDSVHDMIINRDRSMNQVFESYFISGDTEYSFDFSPYSGATLQVKKNYSSSYIVLTFSTLDGSIVLGNDGKFSLIMSADTLENIRAGEYKYDMYLSSTQTPKRAFLSGAFLIKDRVTI